MTFRSVRALAACAVALALLGMPASAIQEQQQPTFRSGTRTVAIYATVSDNSGRLVPDLTKEDFEVFEDGKPRPLTIFSAETQPISVVVMLDRSGSMRTNAKLVAVAAEAFVRRLLPEDRARIGKFSDKVVIEPETFTNDKEALVRIIRSSTVPEGPTPLWNAVDDAMEALQTQEGRKVVVAFTDGADNPMNFRTNNKTLMDVMARGQREDVMVYAIGLESRMPVRPGSGGFGGGGFGGFGSNMGIQRPDPGLPTIAAETGGGYFELTHTDELAPTFTRVAEELHRQYALGFEPAKLDGKTHKLQVKVKKSGMKVRARKSYVASTEG